MDTDQVPAWLEISAAAGTVLAALAGAVAAVFAGQAARASRDTAASTRTALAEVFDTSVRIGMVKVNDEAGHHRGFRVVNDGPHPARNVQWSVEMVDGRTHRGSVELLAVGASVDEQGLMPAEEITEFTPEGFGVPMKAAALSYTDMHGAAVRRREWAVVAMSDPHHPLEWRMVTELRDP